MTKRSDSLKKAQDKYDAITRVIRIDTDVYILVDKYSKDKELTIKATIKAAVENLMEIDCIKQENSSLKIEMTQLKTELDILKGKEKKGFKESLKGLFSK